MSAACPCGPSVHLTRVLIKSWQKDEVEKQNREQMKVHKACWVILTFLNGSFSFPIFCFVLKSLYSGNIVSVPDDVALLLEL